MPLWVRSNDGLGRIPWFDAGRPWREASLSRLGRLVIEQVPGQSREFQVRTSAPEGRVCRAILQRNGRALRVQGSRDAAQPNLTSAARPRSRANRLSLAGVASTGWLPGAARRRGAPTTN
jgi:hypothetical protein